MDAGGLDFSQALHYFDSGAADSTALLTALTADLAAGMDPAALSAILDRHHSAKPLPDELYRSLSDRLGVTGHRPGLEDPTIDLDDPARQRTPGTAIGAELTASPLAGRYQLLEFLGRGGTSEVYKAIDLQKASLGDPNYYVAIKLLLGRARSPEVLELLEQHLQRLRNLVHPNIARPLDWGLTEEVKYIALEYVSGRTLYDHMRVRPLPRSEAILIVGKIAEGLEAAHRQSVIHGDLKPGNVLIAETGAVKLIDFGFEGSPRRPAVTPRYASPQRLQRHAAETSDDVYALACIAFELFTGQPALGTSAVDRGDGRPPPSEQLNVAQNAALSHALDPDRSRRTTDPQLFIQEFLAPAPLERRAAWFKWLPAVLIVGVGLGFLLRQVLLLPHLPAEPPAAARPPTPATSSEPGTVIRDCPTCASMRIIPAGAFTRGEMADSPVASAFEKPRQTVSIATPVAFSIDAVTVGEFETFVKATGRDMQGCEIFDGKWHFDPSASWKNPGFAQSPSHPVTCVSWNDANAYAAWLSQQAGHRYRLPSAAEWEYAARAGGVKAVPWDTAADACRNANVADQSAGRWYPGFKVFACDDGNVHTAAVGSFSANAFGLRDMLGNVFAWTEDCWKDSYAGAPQDGSPWIVANCTERELRGGSWFSSPSVVRASYRNHFAAGYRGSSVGIRLVRTLTP